MSIAHNDWTLCPVASAKSIANFFDNSLKEQEWELTDSKCLSTKATFQVTLYLGKLGFLINIPLMNLFIKTWVPISLKDTTPTRLNIADLAVLIPLYPLPHKNRCDKNFKRQFILGLNLLTFSLSQKSNHLLIYVPYCFFVESRHGDRKMSTASY